MKRFFLCLWSFIMMAVLLPVNAQARDFTYTYEGQTLTYTVLDEEAKTCETKQGHKEVNVFVPQWTEYVPGNRVSNELRIPEIVNDGDVEYVVKKIGECSFPECQYLTSITIPNSVTSIGSDAFYGCTGLTSASIPNSVTSIGDYAFYGCAGLTSVSIPNSVTSIDDYAFYGCAGLTFVSIPNSVTSIGNHAFYGCTGLTSANIPNSVTSIGSDAFYGCTGLTSASIPNSVTSIGFKAFSGCTGLTSVSIPNSVISMNGNFSGCTGLKDFTIEDGETPISIGIEGFRDTPVENLYIGRSWTDTNYYNSPEELKSLTIGHLVKDIPEYAFDDCTGLTAVTIPNSVTSIGKNAFSGCTGLTAVTIPNSVTSIGDHAFSHIDQLESVTIPITVKEMGRDILQGTGVDTLNLYSKSAIDLYELKYINHLIVNKDAAVYFHEDGEGYLYMLKEFIYVSNYSTQATASLTFYPRKSESKSITIVDDFGNEVKFQDAVSIPSTFDYKWDGNTVKYSNLSPGEWYSFKLLGWNYYDHTSEILIDINSEIFADKVRATASFDSGDYSVTDYYWGYEDTHALTVDIPWEANLKSVKFNITGRNNYLVSKTLNLYYPDPTLTDVEAVATALDKARLTAKCNLSNGAIAGIEWRRNDAPDNVKSGEASCPVVAGMLMGELKGLRDDVYYKFRPYYERGDKRYYGDWIGFYTGDAGVYFEPEVGTLPATISAGTVRLEGYAYAGTDNISSAGFEYRVTEMSTRADDGWQTVQTEANTYLRASLEGLLAETEYEYRAFAVAGGKTYYGASDVFTTPADSAGIDEIEAADGSTLEAVLIKNPVVGAPQVKVQSEDGLVRCYIHSIDGSLIYSGDVIADGNVQTIDVRLNGGIHILNLVGKDGRATFRMLTK